MAKITFDQQNINSFLQNNDILQDKTILRNITSELCIKNKGDKENVYVDIYDKCD